MSRPSRPIDSLRRAVYDEAKWKRGTALTASEDVGHIEMNIKVLYRFAKFAIKVELLIKKDQGKTHADWS